jgi:uncharacterized protein involved in tolerance to divalent cations
MLTSYHVCCEITSIKPQRILAAGRVSRPVVKTRSCKAVVNDGVSTQFSDEVNVDEEQMLTIKCPATNFLEIEQCIKANHSYEIPEIIQLSIEAGSADYLKWISNVTK